MQIKDDKIVSVESSINFIENTYGIIVKTAVENESNRVGVFIPRLMMGLDASGGATETTETIKSKIKNFKTKKIGSTSVTARNYVNVVPAKLYNISTPKFVKSERVKVEFGDKDIKTMSIRPFGIDDIEKRSFDTMDFYVPASGAAKTPLDDNNKYFLRLDSENQFAKLHLSNANGEVSEMDLTFDGANGLVSVTDGKRAFGISTDEDIVHMKNEAGSVITLEGGKLTVDVQDAEFIIGNKIKITAPTGEFEIDTMKVTSDSFTGELDSNKISGSKMTVEYDQLEEKLKQRKSESQKDIVDTKIMSVSGPVTCGGMGFGLGPGMMPTPAMANISKQGMADFLGAGSEPLAKAPAVIELLMACAVKADAAGAPWGMPPSAVPQVTARMMSIMSINSKG